MEISKRQREIVKQTLQHAVVAVRTIPNSALIEFLPRLRQAEKILTRELKAWELTQDGSKRYTAHVKRSALVQMDAAIKEIESLGPAMQNTLITSGTLAGEAGLTAMQQQLTSLSAMFEGSTVPVSIERALILDRGKKALIRKYPSSAARYSSNIRKDIMGRLSLGTLQQKTISEMANSMYKDIPQVFNTARFNAMRLVRTEIMSSYNEAHYEGLLDAHEEDSDVKMRWDASWDHRRCPECASLDGQIVEVDGKFTATWSTKGGKGRSSRNVRPPAHPQCFVPDTRVQGNFVAGLKAQYSGKMAKILTKSGRTVTVTPNHPILTDRGWTPAGEVTEEHRLLSYGGDIDGMPSGSLYEQQPPPRVDEAFGLFESSGSSSRSSASAGDLHGDGALVDGDVEIVWAERPFEGRFNGQELGNLSHPVADSQLAFEPSVGGLGKGLLGASATTSCSIGGGHLGRPLGLGHPSPFYRLSLGPASGLNASIAKPKVDDVSTHAEFLGQLIDGAAGLVAFDEVREVRDIYYSGHVYDMQTTSGWQVANGLIASNCRCVLVPWMDDFPESDWNTEPSEFGKSLTQR